MEIFKSFSWIKPKNLLLVFDLKIKKCLFLYDRMSEQHVYVFNQYYIDLLKKIKNYAKEQKDTTKEARDILRAIKKHYANVDKLSTEYIQVLENSDFWSVYNHLEEPWKSESLPEGMIYKDMSMVQISKIFKERYTLHHYLIIFSLFQDNELEIDNVMEVLKHMVTPEFTEKLQTITSDGAKTTLLKLKTLHSMRTSNVLEDELKELESTSLGKLAKEIMADVNIKELQESLQSGNMDILSSLQNPDSGFGKLVSSVSSKMISKLASGELQQENLLQDAMQLASKLPNMLPSLNTGDMGGMGNLGKMFEQFQKMGMDPFKMMSQMNGAQKGQAQTRMKHSDRKNKMNERLKKKIQKKASEQNNNQNEVVEND